MLYPVLLIAVLACFIAMPWIQIESMTTSPGVIAPSLHPFEIKLKSTGRLKLCGLEENSFVQEGDTLFSVWSEAIDKEEFTFAPIDGYVRRLRNDLDMSVLENGEVILEIQPEHELVVKCYLSGDEITSVQPDQNIDFWIKSSANERNKTLSGKVTRILPSILSKGEKPIFEVRCSVDTLENDFHSSELKAGMTLLARFRPARRSAFDIILKDVEDKDRNPA
jgi:multidrug efflux pump subunit AcrA (membrane-fusion protein)